MSGIVCVIPARGGSRRIPGKNKRPFHGRPIIEYSIEAAQLSGLFDEIFVSSDDGDILAIAERMEVLGHFRSVAHQQDEVGTQLVTRQVIMDKGAAGSEFACCIYPCAPMLTPFILQQAHLLLRSTEASFVVPMGEWCVDPGMFYFGRTHSFLIYEDLIGPRTRLLDIPALRAIDINTELDWSEAERRFAQIHKGTPL